MLADIPNLTIRYYDVTGRTPQDIRRELNRVGPVTDSDGQKWDAKTEWRFDWRWPGDGFGGCDLARVDVKFRATITLPRLNSAQWDASTMQQWNRYYRALVEHEGGHARLAYAHRQLLLERLRGSTCSTANAAGRSVIETARAADRAYDLETHHGVSRGARLPN